MNRILTFTLATFLMSAPVVAPPSFAAPPRLDPNEPYKITRCENARNGDRVAFVRLASGEFKRGAWLCDVVTLASAAAPGLGSDKRNRTELAMKCWLGLVGYKGCWQEKSAGCKGPLGVKRVEYLGRTATGFDVYQVRYMERIATYVVTPDPNGNADQYLVKPTDYYLINREITPSAAPSLIYTKPENAPAAGCGGFMMPPQY
jgi:hypothetical protein